MGFIKTVFALLVLALIAFVGAAGYAFYYYEGDGPLAQEKTVLFQRGEHFQAITFDMMGAGVIDHPELFEAIAFITGDYRKFKAGEYHFTAAMSPHQVMDMLAHGHVVIHKLTIPEGLTVQQVVALLTNEKALDGPVAADIHEGSLLPETYHFTYGDKRQELLDRMQADMTLQISKLWEHRKEGLPFKTPAEALVMASIVEKETGIDSERGHIASVFINRLHKGMRLQSDPTVAYGLHKPGEKLTLDDLRAPTPYNTYVIDGLPPGPISNPGRAAIAAVLNPPDTKDLYFVATGSGGHNFAATLEEHNANVKAYRNKQHEAQ
jgi:UPF0755 protein